MGGLVVGKDRIDLVLTEYGVHLWFGRKRTTQGGKSGTYKDVQSPHGSKSKGFISKGLFLRPLGAQEDVSPTPLFRSKRTG